MSPKCPVILPGRERREHLPGRMVGDTYHNTNRSVLVAAPEIALRPVGARQFVAGGRR
jgi:hypothetical protein